MSTRRSLTARVVAMLGAATVGMAMLVPAAQAHTASDY